MSTCVHSESTFKHWNGRITVETIQPKLTQVDLFKKTPYETLPSKSRVDGGNETNQSNNNAMCEFTRVQNNDTPMILLAGMGRF